MINLCRFGGFQFDYIFLFVCYANNIWLLWFCFSIGQIREPETKNSFTGHVKFKLLIDNISRMIHSKVSNKNKKIDYKQIIKYKINI